MENFGIIIVILILLSLYFLPYIVSKIRSSNRSAQVFLLNLFLGWTFVGWVIALVIGVGKNKE